MPVLSETPATPRSHSFVPLVSMSLLTGVGYALAGPFLSLFLIKEVGAGPVAVGAFLLISALASMLVSTLVGRLSDARAIRRTLLVVAGVSGAVGWVLFSALRNYWLLLVVAVTFWAVSSSQIPQMYAYARQLLERSGSARAPLAMSGLRMTMSIAWVGGPPLGALLIGGGGFTWLFGVSAAIYVVAVVVALTWLPELGPAAPPVHEVARRSGLRREVVLAALAFVLLQGATTVGVTAMPLFVTESLGGTTGDAGLVLGLCAALEIPLMLAFGALALRVNHRVLVLSGGAVALVYYSVMLLTQATWQVMAAQVLHAVVISAVMGVGISYFQDLAPDRPGYASTLFTNTYKTSAMLTGPLVGLAQHFGYRTAYGMGLAMSAVGVALLLAARRKVAA
ncbi:sugar efflux transporter [Saccharothrix sp. S26]|uniref:sugar efflux transporter n=1 Tax=Saccharothrix sp. S26 TaxID=2907215 RepID=UPI001F2F869A|nr:sugar efflux transporter [Saccharothrix sp. S26]MCE6997461.1 sugar efflux transporter [Saccharothrix sp. S26]